MDGFESVRRLAAAKHGDLAGDALEFAADDLLAKARETTGIETQRVPPSSPLLSGGIGALHRDMAACFISSALADEVARFVEAHEFGHLWIETPADPAVVPEEANPGTPQEASPIGVRRVEGYSDRELRERYANVFGREFLLPRSKARALFMERQLNAPEIAAHIGVPLGLVHQQLAAALLLPWRHLDTGPEVIRELPELDGSQKAAAEHFGSPLLVEAGPGTGKTRTLVARVEHLIKMGHPAFSILALTYSKKAAGEIRERVAAALPVAAAEIWAGTIHAFGLEICRKYGSRIGMPTALHVVDKAAALELLEAHLGSLELDHYLRIDEPAEVLRYVLDAISRAKDEFKTPAECEAAAVGMRSRARTEDETEAAERAIEMARVYRRYDEILRSAGHVDFGDLINRPIEILRRFPEVRDELRGQYRHLLVDEYQDVNRASALLLKELAGNGDGLWAVGDARQSIYRFRGASPENIRSFSDDYPSGQRKRLEVNYRSRAEIVSAFDTYAAGMGPAFSSAAPLRAARGSGPGAIDFNIADDRDCEIQGLAAATERYRKNGVPYREQAVLCRSHPMLAEIAGGLEARGIPVFYLGDLFERPEVRDLLSMLSFVAEPRRGGLLRIASLPRYAIPLSDARIFLQAAADNGKTPLATLELVDSIGSLSAAGRRGLSLLAADLRGMDYRTGPGSLLSHILFDVGDLLRPELDADRPSDLQRRLAVHQFLQFAVENDWSESGDPKKKLLEWIRRLETFGEEKAFREVPASAASIDAVRLITVHAAKGLEFQVVHLPGLGKGMFPAKRQWQRCPLPEGIAPGSPGQEHMDEERCLFYVALSRARDRLSLSRAQRYTEKKRSNPSEALEAIARLLPRAPGAATATWRQPGRQRPPDRPRPDLAVSLAKQEARHLETYVGCGLRYLYEQALGLMSGGEESPYVRFHRVVYRVLAFAHTLPHPPDWSAIESELEAAWRAHGPLGHPLEPFYISHARRILATAVSRDRTQVQLKREVGFEVGGCRVTLLVDELRLTRDGVLATRIRTGKPPKTPDARHLHGWTLEALRTDHGPNVAFEVHYLSTGTSVPIQLDGKRDDHMADLRAAIAGIGAGVFPPKPDERCPRCPHYFICSIVPD